MQLRTAAAWLRRRAENVAAGMLAVMFLAFVAQIVFRYVLGLPTGWSTELSLVMWLWLVLFGAAFVLSEKDEIRLDLLYRSVGRRPRIAMAIVFSAAALVLYGASLKPTVDYIAFMKVERSSYLKIRMDWLFSIYGIFVAAILARYAWLLWQLVRGRDPEAADVTKTASGL